MPTKGKKQTNTFRFQSFSEQIGKLNIDVHRNERITSKEIPEDDKDTFFRQSLEKWAELNCSIDYTELYSKLKPLVQSFNQLVYHKDKVVDILKQYLTKKQSLAHEACLELLTQLAKDLIDDFYVYFDQFFPLLVRFLETNDAKLIEHTFICFAYIFKFLWRWMLKDLKYFFKSFSCLISSTQKKYVQEFAAEAFAFLLRKSKDKKSSIEFLLQQINDELAEGIGYLLFYTIKGIKKQLCLNGGDQIRILLRSLYLVSTDKEQVLKSLTTTWSSTLKHVSPENGTDLYKALIESIQDVFIKKKSDNWEVLKCYLSLLAHNIDYKDGLFVNKREVMQALSEHMKNLVSIDGIYKELHLIISKLIITHHGDLSEQEIIDFIRDFLKHDSSQMTEKVEFFRCFINWYNFGILKPLALSHFADRFTNIRGSKIVLEFMAEMIFGIDPATKLCQLFPSTLSEGDCLDFQSLQKKVSAHKVILEELTFDLWKVEPSLFWLVTVILTYLKFTPTKVNLDKLHDLIDQILSECQTDTSSYHLFGMVYCIQCFHILKQKNDKTEQLSLSFSSMKNLVKKYPTNDHILQVFELYVRTSQVNTSETRKEEILDVLKCLKVNLNSPYKLTRLLTLQIFDHWKDSIAETEKDLEAFSLCIDAEMIEANFETYRNRLLHLQKLLSRIEDQYSQFVGEAVLRYLIGNLFINFNLVWEPVVKVVASFATDKSKFFWNVWVEILNTTAEICAKPLCTEDNSEEANTSEVCQKFFQVLEDDKSKQRPDYQNFRCLLWNAMAHFPYVVERRSRYIVPLVFQFIEDEYTMNDELCHKTQNISINKVEETVNANEKKVKRNSKQKIKSLCAHLEVFTYFRDPRSLSKEKRIFQFYMEFLTNKEHDLQKKALACLHTYKFPYLKPYTENFEKLMDDTTFREELVRFSSEEESIYKPEHKAQLMPILIRLLYGKLHRKSGLGMGGKTSFSARRNVIMQFLANCSHSEIETFINLIEDPIQLLKGIDILEDDASVDISAIVSLQRQSNFCNMLSTVVSRLRKLCVPFMHTLLSLLLRIIWSNTWCLKYKKDEIQPGMLNRMKELRSSGLLKLIEIFIALPEFDYEDFIEEIFTASVWPRLKELAIEASQHTTPLFQLIVCWSQRPRFAQLLCKQNKNGDSLLSNMFQLLRHKSLSNEMEKQVMTVTLDLLNAKDYIETPDSGKLISVGKSFKSEGSIGVQMIQPYVQDILKYLYDLLSTKTSSINTNTNGKVGQIIPNVQLSILANISKFTTDTNICEKLVAIFFPLLHCIASEDVQINIVRTVENLLPFVGSPTQYLNLVPPLFFMFQGRKPRVTLCDVYLAMCQGDEHSKEVASLVADLNSWDVKWLEEPDYDRRLAAYRKIAASLVGDDWKTEDLLPFLHNCFYFVNNSTDMSLRDASSSTVEAVLKMISGCIGEKRRELFYGIIVKVVVPAIIQGMRLKNEVARHEYIHFLELLVKMFVDDNNNYFIDLKQLTSSDPETDFFQNVRHVQMHRRTRAIHQLTALCKGNKISNKTLHTFVLPMISHVIFDDLAKSKDHNLLTGTIEAIGAIVRGFSWSKYASVLRNYLKVLKKEKKNQKTIIRVVVVILNNFDFDLSKVEQTVKFDGNVKASSVKPDTHDVKNGENAKIEKSERALKKKSTEKDKENGDEMSEDEVVEEEEKDKANASEQMVPQNQHIFVALTTKILPQLHKFFIKKSRVFSYHKLSHNREEDEEEILKVPVAVAIVKLLKHLPEDVMLSNLSGILLRVSQALKSQARDVRDMARDTLKKIVSSLGSSYFSLIIKEMKSVLLRGYQLHVLGYSIHAMLESMQSEMKAGDLDSCVVILMQIVNEELFGTVAEEKNIQGITVKLHEARSKKSNEMIEIIAKYISSGSFALLVGPLKEVLDTSQDHKTRRKVEEAFRRISIGLQQNEGVAPEDLLIFIHGIVSNTLPIIFDQRKKKYEAAKQKVKSEIVREDIYLMPERPTRAGVIPAVSNLTNEHVLVEFGLQQLYTGLKRSKYSHTNKEHVQMLDPFVDILAKSLTSKHPKAVTLAVRCVSLLVKFPLPSLKKSINEIAKQIFKIIKKFARAGAGKGENYEMILSSFKSMTVIIRDYKEFEATENQLQVLLTYVEEDIYDSSRQVTALPLLKAILSRKLSVGEITDIMKKVAEISIRDEDNTTRLQCRQLMMMYLLDYPLGKKISKQFDFYISNLTYGEETGRVSALEMFALMFNKFPEKTLLEYANYFFIPLVMMLINDESALCKKMVGAAVKLLLMKVDTGTRDNLFAIILKWSDQKKAQLRQVSTQLIGTFVEVENEQVRGRLDKIFHIITQILKDGVSADEDAESSENESETEDDVTIESEVKDKDEMKVTDKCLYNALICVGKIFAKLPDLITDKNSLDTVNEYMDLITELLLHSHAWVRLSASQLFGLYFAHVPLEQIFDGKNNTYLAIDTKAKVKDLCLIFYEQLKDEKLTKDIADQATKNLIYITKLVRHIDTSEVNDGGGGIMEENEGDDDGEQERYKTISMKMLVAKMCRLTSFESAYAIKETVKRICVFRWIAAVCLDGSPEQILPYLQDILRPLHREIVTTHNDESELTKLANEVLELIRNQFDKQVFAEIYAKVQKRSNQARESRKRKLAIEAVTDPEKFAKRKQKLTKAKREQKKRKLYEKKPDLKFKKMKSK